MSQSKARAAMTPHKTHVPVMLLVALLLVLAFLMPGLRAQGQGNVRRDRAALEALYAAADGANWENSTNWLTAAPLSEWFGVTIDRDGRITRLELPDNRLNGTLPTELGNLFWLESLQLDGN